MRLPGLCALLLLVGCTGSDDLPITTDDDGTDTTDTDTDTVVETDTVVDTDTDTVVDTDDTDDTDTDPPEDTAPPLHPCLADPTEVEIGTGERSFVSLAPGQDIEMVRGLQDGHHLTGSIVVSNTPELISIRWTVTDIDTGMLLSEAEDNTILQRDTPTWTCDGYLYAYPMVLELPPGVPGTVPTTLCGRRAIMAVELRASSLEDPPLANMLLAEDSVEVRIQPDLDDDGPPCL